MYRLKTIQARRTNAVLTRVKMIVCDSVFNSPSISISYYTRRRDKIYISISWSTTPLVDAGSKSASYSRSSGTCLSSISHRASSTNQLLEHRQFTMRQHMAQHSISLSLRFAKRTPIRHCCHWSPPSPLMR